MTLVRHHKVIMLLLVFGCLAIFCIINENRPTIIIKSTGNHKAMLTIRFLYKYNHMSKTAECLGKFINVTRFAYISKPFGLRCK